MQSETDTLGEVRREFLWRFSKYILHDQDIEWAGEHLAELRKMSVEPAFPLLRYVWNDLTANTQRLARAYPVLAPLAEAVAEYCRFHREVNERTLAAQDELLGALAAADTWPLAIKGTAMRAYTPIPQATSDLDIIARDLDETWALVYVAERLGYPLDKLKLRWLDERVPGAIRYHGYANLYRREGGGAYIQGDWDLGRVRTLDLHIGRFYCLGEGVLLPDLWQRAERRPLGTTQALVPGVDDMLLIELVHLLRHGTLTMRSINRVCQLLDGDAPLDLDYLLAEIHRNDLTLIASATFLAIERSFPHARAVAAELRARLGRLPIWARPAVARLAGLRRVERYGAGVFSSVLIQTHYLYRSSRNQLGYRWPLLRSAVGFTRMFRHRKVYPRAHARWKKRRRGWISAHNRAIMLTRLDRQTWQPKAGWQAMQQHASPVRQSVAVSQTSYLTNPGQPAEVLLTPIGSFTTSNYEGRLSETEAKLCLERAQTLRQAFG